MWKQFNPNPHGYYVGDCVVRALSIALGESWEDIYLGLCVQGLAFSDMPSSNKVWGKYLKNRGYHRYQIPDDYPADYSVSDFCGEHFKGTYILGTGSHVIACVNGNYIDSWDSGDENPIYYWTKEEQ